MEITPILENALYLLALLNPASKIMFLASYDPALTRRQNFELSWKSSLAALLILAILTAAGHVILIRLTGLIIAAISMQMMINGLRHAFF